MKKFLSIMMLFVGVLVMSSSSKASTVDFVDAPVTHSADLGVSSGGVSVKRDVTDDFVRETTKQSYYWRFKIERPSFVRITSYADVYKYNYNGDSCLYLGVNDTCPNKFIDGWANGKEYVFDTLLEKGTYYIRQDITQKTNDVSCINSEPTLSLMIETQDIPKRTGKQSGVNKDGAIPVKSNTVAYGVISGQTSMGSFPVNSLGNQYFVINVKKKTTLNYRVVFNRYGNLGFLHDKVLKIQDDLGMNLVNKKNYTGNLITGSVALPKAGTYYIIVSSKRFASVGVNLAWKDSTPKVVLRVNIIKKNSKKVSGTATNNATIKVKIGKKTYKGKAKNGKFSIKVGKIKKNTIVKVSASKSGCKSKSLILKV